MRGVSNFGTRASPVACWDLLWTQRLNPTRAELLCRIQKTFLAFVKQTDRPGRLTYGRTNNWNTDGRTDRKTK